jgi:hypothetical protein
VKPLCPACELELPSGVVEARQPLPCPFCGRSITILYYPAAVRALVHAPAAEAVAGESTCYFHPRKTAVTACWHCGRFVCALCQTEFGGHSWCPECLTSGATKSRIATLETQRTLYDSVALALSIWPFVLGFWPSLFGAPAALYISVRYWKQPTSIVRRWRWRIVLAMFIALAEIALWGTGVYFMVNRPVVPPPA